MTGNNGNKMYVVFFNRFFLRSKITHIKVKTKFFRLLTELELYSDVTLVLFYYSDTWF